MMRFILFFLSIMPTSLVFSQGKSSDLKTSSQDSVTSITTNHPTTVDCFKEIYGLAVKEKSMMYKLQVYAEMTAEAYTKNDFTSGGSDVYIESAVKSEMKYHDICTEWKSILEEKIGLLKKCGFDEIIELNEKEERKKISVMCDISWFDR